MSTVQPHDLTTNLFDLFRETFEGTGGQGSHYIDGQGHGSFLETLARTDHTAASTSLRQGGATIAAHTAHTLYYLHTLERFMRGEEQVSPDWAGSWQPREVSKSEWQALKAEIKQQYAATMTFLEQLEVWDDEPISGALSMLAHSAYHLGAVRLLAVTLEKER